jgi:Prokaryotic Cytochrome C oxidase subunit IV
VTAAANADSRTARTTTYAWLVLSAVTVVSWWLAPGHTGGHAVANALITVAVALLGIVKGRIIIRYFMEVRTAPRWLKITTDAWLVMLWVTILTIYL